MPLRNPRHPSNQPGRTSEKNGLHVSQCICQGAYKVIVLQDTHSPRVVCYKSIKPWHWTRGKVFVLGVVNKHSSFVPHFLNLICNKCNSNCTAKYTRTKVLGQLSRRRRWLCGQVGNVVQVYRCCLVIYRCHQFNQSGGVQVLPRLLTLRACCDHCGPPFLMCPITPGWPNKFPITWRFIKIRNKHDGMLSIN